MPVKISLITLIILTILLLPSCTSTPDKARVIKVIDGDTIVIEGGHHVRYIGIDTPEVDEPYYSEAKQANQDLVGGKVVRLEEDITNKDKYDRLLRYAYVDNVFVNAELVRQGYAYVEEGFPEKKYYDLLKEAEAQAQAQDKGRGIWISSSP